MTTGIEDADSNLAPFLPHGMWIAGKIAGDTPHALRYCTSPPFSRALMNCPG